MSVFSNCGTQDALPWHHPFVKRRSVCSHQTHYCISGTNSDSRSTLDTVTLTQSSNVQLIKIEPLPFDLTLSYWVYVCCFVLLYFGCYVMCEKKKKKNVDNKKKIEPTSPLRTLHCQSSDKKFISSTEAPKVSGCLTPPSVMWKQMMLKVSFTFLIAYPVV